MSREFRVWLDSGANAFSKREEIVSLGDIGISSEQWDAMSEDERDEVMRDIAFERSDWGYSEIEG